MAKTHEATSEEIVSIDPGLAGGPWTVKLPDPALNGDWVTIHDKAGDNTGITVDTDSGTDTIEDPSTPGTFAAPVTLNFNNISACTWIYDAGEDKWKKWHTARTD